MTLNAAPASAPVIERPVVLSEVRVDYPEALRSVDPPPQGRVVVELVVGVDGVPAEIKVIEGVDDRLDAVVVAAVERLRYRPAPRDGCDQ